MNIWFLNKITANILTNKTSSVLVPTITYIICALRHQSQQINSKTKVSILRPTLFIFKEVPSFGTKKNHKQLSFISLYANYNGIPLISLQNERKNLNKSSFEQLLSVYKITWEILSKKITTANNLWHSKENSKVFMPHPVSSDRIILNDLLFSFIAVK